MGFPITPSMVAFTPEGTAIGDAAKIYLSKDPKNTVFDSKRMIGQQFSAEVVQNDKKNWPFKMQADAQGRA
jgi:molecular chaperone DnaK (HSP70)